MNCLLRLLVDVVLMLLAVGLALLWIANDPFSRVQQIREFLEQPGLRELVDSTKTAIAWSLKFLD